MKNIDSWQRLERKAGKGVMVQYREKTPYEKIMDIGNRIKTRELLQREYWERPLTKAEKIRMKQLAEKIKKDTNHYINSIENKYGKL